MMLPYVFPRYLPNKVRTENQAPKVAAIRDGYWTYPSIPTIIGTEIRDIRNLVIGRHGCGHVRFDKTVDYRVSN